jgi:hypothetical protein
MKPSGPENPPANPNPGISNDHPDHDGAGQATRTKLADRIAAGDRGLGV